MRWQLVKRKRIGKYLVSQLESCNIFLIFKYINKNNKGYEQFNFKL